MTGRQTLKKLTFQIVARLSLIAVITLGIKIIFCYLDLNRRAVVLLAI